MKKLVSISLLFVCFIGVTAAAQPKILEVQDNFNNTYEFDTDEGISSVSSDQEITLTDDTQLTFCITEIEKDEEDTVEYSFESYLNNPRSSGTNKCHTWNLDKSDLTDNLWFDAQITNGDETGWADYGEIDHVARVSYKNVEVAEDNSETTTETHNNRLISESRYEELTEAEQELEEKNQRINELQQRISELEQRVEELTSQINQSEAEEGNRSGPPEGVPANQGNNDEDLPGNQQAKEKRPGFVNNLLGSIFG